MKKSIYISGIVSANLLMLGSVFKVQHWPGANVMLVLAIFLFCFYFLPASLVNSYRGQAEKKHRGLYVITFIVFFITMMGVLFKVMHWPGAAIFLVIGIPLPFVLFLPAYLFYTRKERNPSAINFLGIAFGLIFLAVISVMLSLNVSRNLLLRAELNFADNENAIRVYESGSNSLRPVNSLSQRSNELCSYIEDLKCELLTASGNNFCNEDGLKNYQPASIMYADNEQAFLMVFKKAGENKMETLKEKIDSYRTALLEQAGSNTKLKELANSLFDIKDNFNGTDQFATSWEEEQFPGRQLIFVLQNLSRLQANARILENEIAFSAN